jgi:hypothetical protein
MAGMLWQCNKKKELTENLQAALAFYDNKYGRPALTVWLHPVDAALLKPDGLTVDVKTSTSVLVGCLVIGE